MMNESRSNKIFLITILVVLTSILSYLVYDQIKDNQSLKEQSLIINELEYEPIVSKETIIGENEELPKSKMYYSEVEVNTYNKASLDEEDLVGNGVTGELKHELYVGGNAGKIWFNKNIERLNGKTFLNKNRFFNYKKDLKNKKYYLIGASLKRLDRAKKLRNSLNKKGFHSIILPTKIGFYRVTLRGYEVSENDSYMQEYLEARENSKFKKAWIFVNNNK